MLRSSKALSLTLLASLFAQTAQSAAPPAFETRVFNVVYAKELRADARALQHKLHLNHHEFTVEEKPQRIVISDDTARIRFVITAERTQAPDTDVAALMVVEKMYPHDSSLLMRISDAYKVLSNSAKAFEYMEKSQKEAMHAKPNPGIAQLTGPELATQQQKDFEAMNRFRQGSLEYELKQYDSCITDLTRVIELKPYYETTYFIRSNAYIKLGKNADFERNKQQLRLIKASHALDADLLSDAFRTEMKLRSWAENNQGFERTIADTTRALKTYPHFYALNVLRAEQEQQLGDYSAAVSDYRTAYQHAPADTKLKAELKHAEQLLKAGAPPYGDLSRVSPDTSFIVGEWRHATVSRLVTHKGDLRLYQALAEALTAHGEVIFKQDTKAARAEIEKMLSVVPLKLRTELALYYVAGRPDREVIIDCTDYIDNVHDKIPKLVNALTNRARAYRNLSEYGKALKDYNVLLQLSPTSSEYLRERGDCYLALKRAKEAVDDYSKSIANDPDRLPLAYKQRAAAYDALGLKDLANKDRKTADSAVPAEPKAK